MGSFASEACPSYYSMLTLLLLGGLLQSPAIEDLDALAQKRDVAALSKFLTPDSMTPLNPLNVLKTNGAYDTGRFGWHAVGLQMPGANKSFVVLTTPLTSEDIGEMVFERVGASLRYIPETDSLGIVPLRHSFQVSFDIPAKLVHVRDQLRLQKSGTASTFFFLRMSPYLRVESISSDGKPVRFVQAGGVTAVPSFPNRDGVLAGKPY